MAKIIHAEDDYEMRDLTAKLLVRKEHEVIQAVDGDEALNLIEENKDLDLLITDIKMPRINGYILINKLNEKEYTFPILVCAGDFEEDKVKYNGKLGFLRKPFLVKDFYEKIDKMLE